MPQVKKPEIRDAILAAGFELFSRKGYIETTVADIARAADVTESSLYVYFDSKLLLLYAIYAPWFELRMRELKRSVESFRSPRARLRRIFLGIWEDIPDADHNFASALIAALAVAPAQTPKPANLLKTVEYCLTDLILESLPLHRRHIAQNGLLAHVLWMAFDGFVINKRIGDVRSVEAIADLITNLLLGTTREEEAQRVEDRGTEISVGTEA